MNLRQQFIEDLEDFDEDDCRTLPEQNKKQLLTIVKNIKSGLPIQSFQKQKIGSFGDDIIQAVLVLNYNDLDETLELLKSCCFCQDKFHKHLIKATKDTIDKMSISIQECSQLNLTTRLQLFKFIIGLSEVGIDSKLNLLKLAFQHFVKNINDVSKKIETLNEITSESLQFIDLTQFFITSGDIIILLFNQHLQGLLSNLNEDKLFNIINGKISINPINDTQIAHLKDYSTTFNYVFNTFKQLSTVFDKQQQLAQREKNPTKKNTLLNLVKFGGSFLPVVNDFLEKSYYDKAINFHMILSPNEEIALGNKYFGMNPLSVLKLNVDANFSCHHELQSSNASKAELSFEIPDNVFHHIRTNVSPAGRDLEFIQSRTDLQYYFYDLFIQASSLDDIETLVDYTHQQLKNQQKDIDYVFTLLVNQLVVREANPQHVAHLMIILYFNNIEVYYQQSNISVEKFRSIDENQLLSDQMLGSIEKSRSNASYKCIIVSKLFEVRIISSVQLGKVICSILNKMKKEKSFDFATFNGKDNYYNKLDLLYQLIFINIQYFSLIDYNGIQQINTNFFEPAIVNIKNHFVQKRTHQLEYINRRIKEIQTYFLLNAEQTQEQVVLKDAEILAEEQLKFELQYMKKKKINKRYNKKQEFVEPIIKKTRFQVKYEDFNQIMAQLIVLPSDISDETFEQETLKFFNAYYALVKASYEDSNEIQHTTNGYTPSKRSEFITLHAPDFFITIQKYTNFGSLTFISRLYYTIYSQQLDMKQVIKTYIADIQQCKILNKVTILTALALFKVKLIDLNYENFAINVAKFGFSFIKRNDILCPKDKQNSKFTIFAINSICDKTDMRIGNLTRFLCGNQVDDQMIEINNDLQILGYACQCTGIEAEYVEKVDNQWKFQAQEYEDFAFLNQFGGLD
ncbi:hypothetical protein SS50377_20259 [Spironucleus salmonicida]|uniref:Uncharacterized protein n=1 Tax=Spironucleus salmonicida TaxID=348837 RepID=V6LM70_9EUKA|nr:hypothetical protein SS50377_20259 [Spironucleus salmonicida]|eukprot:EST45313.1 Hypothetical protein SS50377_14890 [Spironucleus salmonicida]